MQEAPRVIFDSPPLEKGYGILKTPEGKTIFYGRIDSITNTRRAVETINRINSNLQGLTTGKEFIGEESLEKLV